MTPLLEQRQPDAASTGTESARTDDAQITPPPTPGAQENTGTAAPVRARRRPGGDDARGAFVCRTCSRRFPSFQALGGHRTGHMRLQARRALPPQKQQQKPAHECAVCGLEFAMGQALGGHMRRHKNDDAQPLVEVEAAGKRKEDTSGSNSPPPPLDVEDRRGDDREAGWSAGSGAEEPRLLNLLV
uniref:Uncharacterized protein n=1 Tax=Avena sativa TaxID=4498 RepID=A0ACD5U1T1_AVESA